MSVDRILGYPINATIKADSVYISHIESLDGESIYVWVVEPGSAKPRAVSIPNTKNNKKQMQNAKDKSKEGIKQQMSPVSKILNKEERIVEIARLLSGKDISEAAITNAIELLNQ